MDDIDGDFEQVWREQRDHLWRVARANRALAALAADLDPGSFSPTSTSTPTSTEAFDA